MNRKALTHLTSWIAQTNPKPLVLRGARQVGKSYLAQALADATNYDLVTVNFEKTKIREIDNQESFEINKVLSEISLATGKRITDRSLIFLDEIQGQPRALASLRYFYEEKPGIKVLAAGSLLEVICRKFDFSMPVGRVQYLYLSPMSFFEFLEALGEGILLEQIREISFESGNNRTLHEKAIQLLKMYYFVGGMPEAVKEFAATRSFDAARSVHFSLIQSYKDDVLKYASGEESKTILDVFNYVPAHAGEKVVYSTISSRHSSYVKSAIETLSLANVIYRTCNNRCTGLPLAAGADCDSQKLYFLDIGLCNAMLGTTWADLFQLAPEQLLIKGSLAEQFVAQHLRLVNREHEFEVLYYWLRQGRKGAAEVDFIVANEGRIYPVEIKSGASGHMRSLWQLVHERKFPIALRFDLALRRRFKSSIKHQIKTSDGIHLVECDLIGLPLYVVEDLVKFLS